MRGWSTGTSAGADSEGRFEGEGLVVVSIMLHSTLAFGKDPTPFKWGDAR